MCICHTIIWVFSRIFAHAVFKFLIFRQNDRFYHEPQNSLLWKNTSPVCEDLIDWNDTGTDVELKPLRNKRVVTLRFDRNRGKEKSVSQTRGVDNNESFRFIWYRHHKKRYQQTRYGQRAFQRAGRHTPVSATRPFPVHSVRRK